MLMAMCQCWMQDPELVNVVWKFGIWKPLNPQSPGWASSFLGPGGVMTQLDDGAIDNPIRTSLIQEPNPSWRRGSHSVVSDSLRPHGLYPPRSSVHGILQERILEWGAFPFPGDLPAPGIKPWSHALQADSLPSQPASCWSSVSLPC